MKQVRGSKTTDLHTTGREREGRGERELATMSKKVLGGRQKIVEAQVLGQRLITNHILMLKNTKMSTTQVQFVIVRVVAMIIELIMGLRPQLHPPEKELRGRLLKMTTIGTRIAVRDILLLMNGDILLPVNEEEEGRGGEGTMREDHLPRQRRDRKGVEPRIVSVNEAVVQKKELEVEKERHLVNMMMAIIKGAEEAEGEDGSSNHHIIQPHQRITCLRTEGALPLAVAGDPLCYQIPQDPLHYYHLLT